MMPRHSHNSKDIFRLLSKLKAETPEYPAEMLKARKAAFLKQAATLKVQGKGEGGLVAPGNGNSVNESQPDSPDKPRKK